MTQQAAADSGREYRFEFGKNGQRFLRIINLNCIAEAEWSLQDMLGKRA